MSHDDPEKRDLFVFGEGVYSSVQTWKLVVTPEKLELVPAETPRGQIIGVNVFLLLFTCLFLFLSIRFVDTIHPAAIVFGILLIAATIGGSITGVTLMSIRDAQRHGPWLIVDRVEGIVHLPGHDLSVPISQVDHLQAVTSRIFGQKITNRTALLSELNIVLREGDTTRRYPMLRNAYAKGFDALAKEIAALNILPVKCVHGLDRSTWIGEKWLTAHRPESTDHA